MISEHLDRIKQQLAKGPTIGNRKTPVVSFWPIREKWEKYGNYWELWGLDGDLYAIPGTMDQMAPAELRLIYFVIPGSDTVCQLAYEHDSAEIECGRTSLRRNNRIAENLRQGMRAVREKLTA